MRGDQENLRALLDFGREWRESEVEKKAPRFRSLLLARERNRPRDMKLEVVVVPVSDVDRAKGFYEGLGWRLDADFAGEDDFRVVRLTPPG